MSSFVVREVRLQVSEEMLKIRREKRNVERSIKCVGSGRRKVIKERNKEKKRNKKRVKKEARKNRNKGCRGGCEREKKRLWRDEMKGNRGRQEERGVRKKGVKGEGKKLGWVEEED